VSLVVKQDVEDVAQRQPDQREAHDGQQQGGRELHAVQG
jgi:hypothetical protein